MHTQISTNEWERHFEELFEEQLLKQEEVWDNTYNNEWQITTDMIKKNISRTKIPKGT